MQCGNGECLRRASADCTTISGLLEAARKLLAGHHIMIIGDLHAPLHYAALVFC